MRYGTFHYGDGTLYGSSNNPNLLWALEVDWDGDGLFDGSNEARYAVGMWGERGRRALINASGDGFERPITGECFATLENVDGRYDANNISSPLYPYIAPGKKARVRLKVGSSGAWKSVMTGRLADLLPISGEERVQMILLDDKVILEATPVSIAVVANGQIDDLLNLVLDEIGWPDADRTIDASTDTIPYWWADGVSAWQALSELAEAALGQFYIAADGKATFLSRSHSTTPTITLDQEDLSREIGLAQPWENLRNQVEVKAWPRVAVAATELWQLQEKTSVAAGATIEIWLGITYDGTGAPAAALDSFRAMTDYTMNTAADGSGTDLTYSFTIVPYLFGTRVKLKITNNSASTGYITLLKVMGTALPAPNDISKKGEDEASIKRFGTRKFVLESDWIQDSNLAESYADNLVENLALARAFPTVELENQPDLQFELDLGTRATLNVPKKGIANVYATAWLSWQWLSENGQAVRTAARMEPLPPAAVQWTFPVKIGEESYFAF